MLKIELLGKNPYTFYLIVFVLEPIIYYGKILPMNNRSIVSVKANLLFAFFHMPKSITNLVWFLIRPDQLIIGSFSISFPNMSICQLSNLDNLPPFKPISGETSSVG